MRVLFLDIDGVLNSADYFKRSRDHWADVAGVTLAMRAVRMMDPEAVAHLMAITKRSGARIVISSSWRLAFPVPVIQDALVAQGGPYSIIDKTGYRSDGDNTTRRGLEIQGWLDGWRDCHREPIESFVILDDSADMGPLLPKLVRTTWQHGLRAEHIEPALRILEVA